jgi:hypothetical protein
MTPDLTPEEEYEIDIQETMADHFVPRYEAISMIEAKKRKEQGELR